MKQFFTAIILLGVIQISLSQSVSTTTTLPGTVSGSDRIFTLNATTSCTNNSKFSAAGQWQITAYGTSPSSTTVMNFSTTLINNSRTATATASIPATAIFVTVKYIYNAHGSCPAGSITSTLNTGTGALPIDLIDFKAKNTDKTISLNWRTAEEKNVNFFAIERSKNGRDFKEIAQVKTGAASKEYNLVDEKPFYGTSYYRLKMAENDGSAVNFSKTVSVNMSTKGALKVTPTMASEILTVDLPENLGEITINVMDMTGKVIKSVITSSLQESINVTDMAPGMYILSAQSGVDTYTERFVKQ